MKKAFLKGILLLGYLIPFVFLAMREDANYGSMWSYLILIAGFCVLCFGCIRIKGIWILICGNFISFVSSCFCTYFNMTEKWNWYFKPFTPYQLILFETILLFVVQVVIAKHFIKKANTKEE